MLLLVFLQPYDPPINAHDGIIQVYTGFAIEVPVYAQENIYDGADQPDGIYPYVLDARKPNAYNTCNNSNIFRQGGCPHACHKLPVNFFPRHCKAAR
jgi:hypothetical protein